MPPVEVFREGDCAVVQLALQLTREKRSFCFYAPTGCDNNVLTASCLKLFDNHTIATRTHGAWRQLDAEEQIEQVEAQDPATLRRHAFLRGQGIYARTNAL